MTEAKEQSSLEEQILVQHLSAEEAEGGGNLVFKNQGKRPIYSAGRDLEEELGMANDKEA